MILRMMLLGFIFINASRALADDGWIAFSCDRSIYQTIKTGSASCPAIDAEQWGMIYYISEGSLDNLLDHLPTASGVSSEIRNARTILLREAEKNDFSGVWGIIYRFNSEQGAEQDCEILIIQTINSIRRVVRRLNITNRCREKMVYLAFFSSDYFNLNDTVYLDRVSAPTVEYAAAESDDFLGAATLRYSAAVVEGELNVYSSRQIDEQLYSDFEEQTGVLINSIEGNADELIARMEADGFNSPADVFLTEDAARLERANRLGLLQPANSFILATQIPDRFQAQDNTWFGFSLRARIIFYDKNDVRFPPLNYLDLANPAYKGMVCHRSSTDVSSQTLMSFMIANYGEETTLRWAEGIVANFAREPQGGDTDQLRGLVSGECDIAIADSYSFSRALRREVDGLPSSSLEGIGWVFPSQNDVGTHVNISGGGIAAYAPNRRNALRFLEYLSSDRAQQFISSGNDEYPAVASVQLSPSVAQLGAFRPSDAELWEVVQNVSLANRIFREAGWE